MGKLLTRQEAADYLRVKKRTLREWEVKNTGPQFVRMAERIIRYRQEDLDDYLKTKISVKGDKPS